MQPALLQHAAAALFAAVALTAAAGPIQLLKDINRSMRPVDERPIAVAGGWVVELCDNYRCLPYFTDATSANTRALMQEHADPSQMKFLTQALPGGYFFAPSAGASRVWRTDGTAAGTMPVAAGSTPNLNVRPAALGATLVYVADNNGLVVSDGTASSPQGIVDSVDVSKPLVAAGNAVWFFRDLPTKNSLWMTDGTPGFATLVGEFGAANQVGRQFALGNRVLFAVNSQLWVSDGTTPGTLVLAEVGPAGGRDIVRVGSLAYFFAKADGSATTQIWRTDGTPAGTAQIASFTGTLVPGAFAGGDSLAYFRIANGSEQIWRTDGTADGTVQLSPFPGGSPFVMVGDTAWFLDYSGQGFSVWRSDGTAAGTATQPFLRGLYPMYALGTDLVLGNVGTWMTDGTEAGTRVLEVAPGEPSEASQCGAAPAVLGDLVIFAASDAQHGCEAWRTDGTEAGTFMLRDATPGRSISAYVASMVRMGSRVYFAVNDGSGGTLWQTDGTTAGTSLVRNAGAPPLGAIFQMVAAGPTLYFLVQNGGLWKSDGTAAGTARIGTTNFNSPRNMTAVGGLVYFIDGTSPFARLWRSDGSPAGTLALANLEFAGDPFLPGKFVAAGDKLVFGANGKPWVSDGTVAGTHQLADLQIAYATGMVGSAGGYAIFSALENGTLPPKVFATDGTAAGTVKLGDHDAYTNASVASGGKLYYSDFAGAIHVTDGTPAGTRVAIAFVSGSCCSPSRPLGGDAGTLFFLGQDAAHGYEIWKAGADGVPTLVEDFHPGIDGIDLGAGLDFTTFGHGAFLMAPSLRYGSEPHLIDYVALPTVTFAADFYRVLDNGSTELTVERRGPAAGAASVHWSTENGTAVAGQDFGSAGSASQRSGTLSWASGDATPKKITLGDTHANIPLIAGATHEPDEMFGVRLSAPTGGAALGDIPVAAVTITDATQQVEFQASAVTVGETGQNVILRVVRTGALDTPATVTWQSIAGTAEAGVDFGSGATPAPQGTLAFAAGEFEKTIAVGPVAAPAPYVAVNADGIVEPDETFTIKLASSTPGLVLGPNAITTITIRSAEAGVTMATENISVAEGPATVARVRVDRLGPAGSALSVPYQSFDQYAIAGVDYTAVSGTLTWSTSDLQPKFIDVPIIDNTVSNPPRDFVVVLLSSPVPVLFSATAVAIIDNESGAYFSADAEVSEADGMATLRIARSGSSAGATTVRWTTGNGSAIAGQDFGVRGSSAQRSGTVSWSAGDTAEKSISIPILQDTISEAPETFTVTLSAPTGGLTLGSPSVATVTIVDDEIAAESAISFVQPKVLAMEDGGTAVLTLHREAINGSFSAPVAVTYATSPGTALAGSDYLTKSGSIAWAANDSGDKAISIAIVNDSVAESHESFKVTLATSSPGAIVTTPEATVTIIDDDDAFPKYGVVPAGWTMPAAATSGWHAANDPGAYEGVFSLRSDAIDDGEAAQVEVTRVFAAGNVSFRWKVSSEPDFDKLRFFVDGVERGSWSGTAVAGWSLFSTPVTAGSHTLRWSYEKDGSASVGQDAAWIDAVVLP